MVASPLPEVLDECHGGPVRPSEALSRPTKGIHPGATEFGRLCAFPQVRACFPRAPNAQKRCILHGRQQPNRLQCLLLTSRESAGGNILDPSVKVR